MRPRKSAGVKGCRGGHGDLLNRGCRDCSLGKTVEPCRILAPWKSLRALPNGRVQAGLARLTRRSALTALFRGRFVDAREWGRPCRMPA